VDYYRPSHFPGEYYFLFLLLGIGGVLNNAEKAGGKLVVSGN
jgi:hypothetical protein